MVVAVFAFALYGRESNTGQTPYSSRSVDSQTIDPLDKISSADIAVSVAELTRLDEETAVRNNADPVNSQLNSGYSDSDIIAKPQIVSTESKSINDLVTYTVGDGDDLKSIAKKYGISENSIKWSNDLDSDDVEEGDKLSIPPVNGIVYKVKDGDTAKSIAESYQADKDEIIEFNDAEIAGIKKGDIIVIPDGKIPAPTIVSTPTTSGGASSTGGNFSWGGSQAIYGYNGYDYGYCTWYAANRRAQVGKPIPANLGHASTWKALAQRAGLSVGNTPAKYAVIWSPPRDYYGHVAFVEDVYPDGSVLVSEMNVAGWNVRSTKVLSASQAAGYSYIY